MTTLSKREWIVMLIAAGWGALLGAIPFQGASTGTFVTALLGPPIAYLLLRKRPLLAWQIPIISASIAMALQDRDPHGPYTQGPIWPIIGLGWVVSSLFSVPWPYIFQRTMHRDGEKPATVAKAAKMSLGIGLLIFLACGLILLGFAAIVYPIASPLQGDVSLADQSLGFLMATVGIALAVYICQNTEKLGLDYQIDSLFGWLLGLIALTVVPSIFLDLHDGSYHCAPSVTNCTQLGPPLQEFLNFVAALEAVAVVIWLLRRGRRAKKKTRLLRSES